MYEYRGTWYLLIFNLESSRNPHSSETSKVRRKTINCKAKSMCEVHSQWGVRRAADK